jgi:AraC-like DNA-binding protein
MIISASVAITVISIFCLQAIIFAILLIFKNPRTQANILLCIVLCFFALAAFNLALFYLLVLLDHVNWIPYLQLELLFGLGPSLYLYTKSVADPGYKIRKWRYLHFLPVVLEFLYYRTSLYRSGATSFTEYPHSLSNWVFIFEQWAGTISASIYVIGSVKLLSDYHSWAKKNFSNLNGKTLKWLMNPVIAYASFWLLWHVIRLADLFIYADSYRDYYFYPMFIILSAITCWIGFKGYIKTQIDAVGFITGRKPQRATLNLDSNTPSATGQIIKDKMAKDKLYLDIDLSLESFSKTVGLNPKLVSKTINSEFNINFLEFVNQYRVFEFMERLKKPGHEKLTIWGHALESGFASKSTFNHIFKKYKKLTPKGYYKQIGNKNPEMMSENLISDF